MNTLTITMTTGVDKKVNAEDIAENIVLHEHDVLDGFEITTDVPGYDNTKDFFLYGGEIVEVVAGTRTKAEYQLGKALEWVWDHCGEDEFSYAFAMEQMNFSRDEVWEHLIDDCGIGEEEADKIITEIF